MYKRLQENILRKRLQEPIRFIQVVIGPRQTGKPRLFAKRWKGLARRGTTFLRMSPRSRMFYGSFSSETLPDKLGGTRGQTERFWRSMNVKKFWVGPKPSNDCGMKIVQSRSL